MDTHSCKDVWGCMPEIGTELEVNLDDETFGGSNSQWDWGSLCSEPHDLAQECLACSEGSEFLDLELESETGESELSSGVLEEPESDWESGNPSHSPSTSNATTTPKQRESKNARERMRIREKKKALQEVKELAKSSDLIDGESKKKRWTEQYTLEQTVCLINFLRVNIAKHGRPSQVPLPLARKTVNRGAKKPPNRFLRFSQAMRPAFMMVLKAHLYPRRSEAELADVQVNNREVTKFLSAVWRSLSPEEKRHDWGHINEKERLEFVKLARGMIHTYSSIAS